MIRLDLGTGSGRLILAAFPVVVALMPLGCADSGPTKGSVTGKITCGSQPVPKGTITFVSTDPNRRNAIGAIRSDGTYRLQTEVPGDGAILGDYQVAISSRDDAILDYTPLKPIRPRRLIPARYEDPAASGLTATVKKGSNTLNFELLR